MKNPVHDKKRRFFVAKPAGAITTTKIMVPEKGIVRGGGWFTSIPERIVRTSAGIKPMGYLPNDLQIDATGGLYREVPHHIVGFRLCRTIKRRRKK